MSYMLYIGVYDDRVYDKFEKIATMTEIRDQL